MAQDEAVLVYAPCTVAARWYTRHRRTVRAAPVMNEVPDARGLAAPVVRGLAPPAVRGLAPLACSERARVPSNCETCVSMVRRLPSGSFVTCKCVARLTVRRQIQRRRLCGG